MGLFGFFGLGKNKQEFISLDELYKIFEEEWKRTPHYLHAVDLASKVLSNKAKLSNQDHATLDWCNSVILAKDDECREICWRKIKNIYQKLINYEKFTRVMLTDRFHKEYFEEVYYATIFAGSCKEYKTANGGLFTVYCNLVDIFVVQSKKASKTNESNKKYFKDLSKHFCKVSEEWKNNPKRSLQKEVVQYYEYVVKVFRF